MFPFLASLGPMSHPQIPVQRTAWSDPDKQHMVNISKDFTVCIPCLLMKPCKLFWEIVYKCLMHGAKTPGFLWANSPNPHFVSCFLNGFCVICISKMIANTSAEIHCSRILFICLAQTWVAHLQCNALGLYLSMCIAMNWELQMLDIGQPQVIQLLAMVLYHLSHWFPFP